MTHLLVIEDHPDIMYILTRLLRAAGYEVSAAHDGVEGVALALQLQPDLVLLDLAIPRMDGWQWNTYNGACKRLQGQTSLTVFKSLGEPMRCCRQSSSCSPQLARQPE
jgi:CheY-like chemotaxis protein